MNKALFIERVRMIHGNRLTAEQAVEAVLDTLVRAVTEGESVAITGFGTMEAQDQNARKARNPATGEKMWLAATKRVRFRPGQGFIDLVTGARKLPESSSAIRKAPKGTVSKGSAKL